MDLVKIYALKNPIDDLIFYVGATSQDLKSRLSQHISQSTYGLKNGKEDTISYEKNTLVSNIIANGVTPEIIC